MKKTSLLVKILLLILGILIGLSLTEIGLRTKRKLLASHVEKYDSQTGLNILYPSYQFRAFSPCFDNLVLANSQGFNDFEFNFQKPKDVFRIAILGDSFVEAYQVAIEKSFQSLLEEKLNQFAGQNKKFQIYTFGHGGNGTFKNYLYLNQYALKYQPDLVILAFLPANDFFNDYEFRSEIFDREGKVKKNLSALERLINQSVLISWLRAKWRIVKTYSFKSSVSQVPFDFQVFLKDYPQSWFKIWDLEKKLLMQFKKTVVEEKGSKFLLISLPDIWRTHPQLMKEEEKIKENLNQFEFDFDKPEKILADFSRTEKIPYLNLTPIFREKAQKEKEMVFYQCDGHWNETGHGWAAQILFEYLKQNHEIFFANSIN